MQRRHFTPLLPLLVLAACTGDQSPTTPAQPEEAGSPDVVATAGHRVVNSLADPGDGTCNASQCTLREAVNASGTTEITFAPGLTGSITLAKPAGGGGTLVIEKSLTITAPSAGMTIQRRMTDPDFRILRIGTGVSVQLTNLTLRNGKTDGGGGGINNFGTLALTHCTVADDTASSGGGIDNHGMLALSQSTVSGNTAIRVGGGISNCGQCRLTATNSVIEANSANVAGGIENHGGVLALTNSTIARNSGGGIGIFFGAALLTGVRIVDNVQGSGIRVVGPNASVKLTNSTIARNATPFDGGGIDNATGSTFTIRNSTIVGNSAVHGGGINNEALAFGRVPSDLTLINSTVSGNAAAVGGGIFNRNHLEEAPATVRLTNSTVVRNSATQEGGGIELPSGSSGTLVLVNSVVAQNHAPAGPDVFKFASNFVAARFNLIGDGSGSGIGNTDGNQVGRTSPNTLPIDARLGPLTDNGGPTRTHALLAGSPALDAGSTPDCPATDQRGVARPQGPGCDIGSYERR